MSHFSIGTGGDRADPRPVTAGEGISEPNSA
jgi:hypothetical protein